MKTLLSVPQELLETARNLGGIKTKSETVTRALETYIRTQRLGRLLQRKGKGFGLTLRALLQTRRGK